MTAKRVYQKRSRTDEQTRELREIRARYQREKPTPEQALAGSGQSELMPLGEVMFLHEVLSLLRRERERQGVTLAELEQRTGISQATLSRLERGKSPNPTLQTIYRISTALGKSVGCYLQDAPPSRRTA